ncbi:prepilin-type N-terminal cleavage/methylation domain-containing protein [Gallaecimonas kandeliae]|uniref:prepilin-type N-terminal cleavage/methylation domain-containing protein n=1 Tax=Gallaecimonas kandeliae TaxID=3029055 RepID=UPI0026498474|nr:prepilin-type N-terminal cleavage/methylation domain-containing protein [Gallaecimonas kandeliae]WKE65668.1 prepilin-type N-terminal cleavage/methylation domain-containing protein [Gallaecimonas kandeliae]
MSKGFTLIELLIALTLTALLATLMGGGLELATGTWQRLGKSGQQAERALMVQITLRRLLEQLSTQMVLSQDVGLPGLRGDSQHLLFLAPGLPQLGKDKELYWYRLGMVEDEDQTTSLTLCLSPWLADEQVDWPILEQRLLSGGDCHALSSQVTGLELEYLKVDQRSERWQSLWENEAKLPALLRLHFETGKPTLWPDLLVLPMSHAYEIKSSY